MRQSGALRIFTYNWPIYVGTWTFAIGSALVAQRLPSPLALLALSASAVAIVWSFASLLISAYVYDWSALSGGTWVSELLGKPETWATIHAGLDAEVDVDAALGPGCVARLDIFDAELMTSPSIARARTRTPPVHAVVPCKATALPLADASCDAIVVAFTAHEIRDDKAREAFFSELRRALKPEGRALVVEHLRDLPNFMAFGPGFLHFVARTEWRRLVALARLDVVREARVTPWVMALTVSRQR